VIDIEDQLRAPLHENDTYVTGRETDDPPKVPVFDEVVDNSSPQLQGNDFKEKHHDGQQHENELVPSARRENKPEHVARHFASRRLSIYRQAPCAVVGPE
jgi:hypothetical protein